MDISVQAAARALRWVEARSFVDVLSFIHNKQFFASIITEPVRLNVLARKLVPARRSQIFLTYF